MKKNTVEKACYDINDTVFRSRFRECAAMRHEDKQLII